MKYFSIILFLLIPLVPVAQPLGTIINEVTSQKRLQQNTPLSKTSSPQQPVLPPFKPSSSTKKNADSINVNSSQSSMPTSERQGNQSSECNRKLAIQARIIRLQREKIQQLQKALKKRGG